MGIVPSAHGINWRSGIHSSNFSYWGAWDGSENSRFHILGLLREVADHFSAQAGAISTASALGASNHRVGRLYSGLLLLLRVVQQLLLLQLPGSASLGSCSRRPAETSVLVLSRLSQKSSLPIFFCLWFWLCSGSFLFARLRHCGSSRLDLAVVTLCSQLPWLVSGSFLPYLKIIKSPLENR
jgi:hypothetical protein